jgi:Concanavalin A-like lectin/glucanases superfamily
LLSACWASQASAGTVALWLFDEQAEIYPSCLLNDASGNGHIVAIGRGGRIVEGRFGRALEPIQPQPLKINSSSHNVQFGLKPLPPAPGRKIEPMTWMNATFCALSTNGEKHLRTPGFPNVTASKLNLGAFDWTVEFWFMPTRDSAGQGIVFEIGQGPRGENDRVTRLSLDADRSAFTLLNQPSGVALKIPTDRGVLRQGWHHLAFVYDAAALQLHHYVDGSVQPLPAKAALKALDHGDEAYLSIGRDGLWNRPLTGRLDELRVSDHQVYTAAFRPPDSFSVTYGHGLPKVTLKAGPPLLFGPTAATTGAVPLGSRKHLFLDAALVAEMRGITFTPNPPRRAEKVLDHVRGHLSMVDDPDGVLRLYYRGPEDTLAVMTSKDGIHWVKPDLGYGEYQGEKNIVLRKPVALGNVFLDPNAPPEGRWKYVSGIRRQSIFVYSSPDGWSFQQNETAALPFAAGSQSVVFYDDQRQSYMGYHRSDYGETAAGHTQRRQVLSEVKDLLAPWPFDHITSERTAEVARHEPIQADKLDPWFLDNGPLTPPGLGIELPTAMGRDPSIDPEGTDLYVSKAVKYGWAPDAYLAFPSVYFHYRDDGPNTRRILGTKERGRGSGVTEVQVSVSRDGASWKRYPRPAYVPLGGDGSNSSHMYFLTHGVFRRGNEIWQYVGGHDGNGIAYHSAIGEKGPWPLYRLVQRLDGFVAAEAAYTGGMLRTRTLTFMGKRLRLNVDTGATGFVQVGFLDADGNPIPGYSVDEGIYINGDFLDTPAEWMEQGSDLASLAGRPVQIVFRMRGARLYAMQFTPE